MPEPEYEVKDGEVHEVSLVGTPANGREFAMFKSVNEIKQLEKALEKAVHNPEYMKKDERDWNSPDLEDFETDDLSEVDNHFIASTSDFPPEDFTDLKLPVVEPDGTLNKNAVDNAAARVSQTEGIDTERAESIINNLQEEFETEEDMDKQIVDIEKRSISPQEFAEFIASHVEGASPADILDAINDINGEGELQNLDQRELATVVGDAYNMSTGEVLDILERMSKEFQKGGSESVDPEEIVEAFKELDDEEREEIADEIGLEKESEEQEEEEDEVEKDLDPEVREELKELRKSNEQLREERELEKMEKSVEENYSFIPGETTEVAKLLKSVKDGVSEDQFETLEEKLHAIEEQIDLEKTLQEEGTQETDPSSDVEDQVEKLVDEKMEKADYDNRAEAEAAVWDEKPKLAEKYYQNK
jgi:hypothetical protein